MATYAIGDVQGCLAALEKLLTTIHFNPAQDCLWFTGDLVNRGPQSLETLRFIKQLGNQHVVVLGNHDLHLLAVAKGVQAKKKHDTFDEILAAADRDELLQWLECRPLLHAEQNWVMTHAGIAPQWDIPTAIRLAQEAEKILRGNESSIYLKQMYGNTPVKWDESLKGAERFRCIINYFTRMRFCLADGSLELDFKGRVADKPSHLLPWFTLKDRKNTESKILFGHWAALGGQTSIPNVYALDTGCVWGNCLSALRLDDEQRFKVSCINT